VCKRTVNSSLVGMDEQKYQENWKKIIKKIKS